ncbi:SigE family RNA polymerase sigma factor [Actinacidiphila alni]|uniref:SigE family RNA polymerase sigma factor n=1 Tax=Actinacidiphila alni TaxID=380248 RepID=UPI0033D8FDE0
MRADETAEFTAFVRARSGALFRTAVLLTGERGQAEDLLQSTLERVCKHWRKVSRADSPEAYARRILVNLIHDRGRSRRGRIEVPLDEQDFAPPDPRDPYHRLAVRDELLHVLHSLPVSMRAVLVLRYFDDLPDPDIATALGITESTVRSQAARGLAKMRAAAGRRPIESPHGGGQ